MNRIEFAEELDRAGTKLNYEGVIACHKKRIADSPADDIHPQGYDGLIICMEEFNELSKEVSKYYRMKGNQLDLLQEIADAWLSIEYIKRLCQFDDTMIIKAINAKTKRNMIELGLLRKGEDDHGKDSKI